MISSSTSYQPFAYSMQRKSISKDFVQEHGYFNCSQKNKHLIENHRKELSQSPQFSSAEQLKCKLAKLNGELLLPQFLQKTLKKKFTLSPLSRSLQKPESPFKLRNYYNSLDRQFGAKKQVEYEQNQCVYGLRKSINSQSQSMQLTFLRQNKKQAKVPMPFQHQLTNILMYQSKLKYSPKDPCKQTLPKWRKSQSKIQENQTPTLNRTNSGTDGFSLNSVEKRSRIGSNMNSIERRSTNRFKDQSSQLLNSTRSKLLCGTDKVYAKAITKTDLFPLEKLLLERKKKISFRNKWFDQKSYNHQNQ